MTDLDGLERLWNCLDSPTLARSEPDTTIRGAAHRFVTTDAGRRADKVGRSGFGLGFHGVADGLGDDPAVLDHERVGTVTHARVFGVRGPPENANRPTSSRLVYT